MADQLLFMTRIREEEEVGKTNCQISTCLTTDIGFISTQASLEMQLQLCPE